MTVKKEEKIAGETHDFFERVTQARRYWNSKMQILSRKGLGKEKTSFHIEIINSKKEVLRMSFACLDILELFKNFRNHQHIKHIEKAVQPRLLKIIKDHILTVGEQGLSVTSNILIEVFNEMERRLDTEKERLNKARKNLYYTARHIFKDKLGLQQISIRIGMDGTCIYENYFIVEVRVKNHPAFETITFREKDSRKIIKSMEAFASEISSAK
ncbi:MAG: hypothetical protein NT136_02750 [Candidatus Moranbacteria bacterium]|nr:hypothetical protein [Candidatus Moranbacteria bacterium]